MAAAARAAHLLVDRPPFILQDDLAKSLLGPGGEIALGYQLQHPDEPVLAAARASATIRSRYAESLLAASPCDQYVVLGAGLDTSGIRVAAPAGRRVFDVDLPQVLAWRRDAFAQAGIGLPAEVTGVPADLAAEPLLPALCRVGFDADRPAFVSCLGVTMYLSEDAVRGLLGQLGDLVEGSELVLDHILPPDERDEAGAAYARAVAAMAGASGEPWKLSVCGAGLAAWLTELGWRSVTCTGEAEAVPPQSWDRTDSLRPQRLVGLLHASR
jgi:methyltransferase (TIGR00027 family)